MRLLTFFLASFAFAQDVTIKVDAARPAGPLRPVWNYFGYDEPNYPYMKDGKKLLSELAALSPVPVHVRAHNLLTTGDGTAALKWGSTNAYTEDAQGNPIYNWTIVDRIFDTYVERKMKPLVEIGFMPEALSAKPQPYRHEWAPDKTYNRIFTGWAHPPKDPKKWGELVYQWVKHCVEKYGREEVASWWWEVWNEPDIGYWQGTPEQYFEIYDHAADAVKRALPAIRIGGPTTTGPKNEKAAKFLRDFLQHVVSGKNYATGKIGSPLDYISFHAKGRPKFIENRVQMGSEFQMSDLDTGFGIVASFPTLKRLPIIIGESDPEGCAACSVRFHPQNGYRNGTMYSSYTAATFARKHEIAAKHGVNFEGAVTWAFEFENQPYFDGFRDLATNGIDKPVLNVFRMFGMMSGQRLPVQSSGALPLAEMIKSGVKAGADINAVASRAERAIHVMAWNYHDDDLPAVAAAVTTSVTGLPLTAKRVQIRHFRIDRTHSNSYTVWQAMGSPQQPTPAQYAQLEAAGQLQMLGSPEWRSPLKGSLDLAFSLPRQGVSLIEITW
ncbi:MAG: beta-xylosidase [Acidobacteria bacterium]|nr:beta-xylosidase [Acidobacteriota bacterium]